MCTPQKEQKVGEIITVKISEKREIYEEKRKVTQKEFENRPPGYEDWDEYPER